MEAHRVLFAIAWVYAFKQIINYPLELNLVVRNNVKYIQDLGFELDHTKKTI